MKRNLFFLSIILAAASLPCLLASCGKPSQLSVPAQLDAADQHIQAGNTQEALSILNGISLKNITPSYALGLYRRYNILGENSRSENVLKKALKYEPKNLELAATYTRLLVRQNKIGKALKQGKILMESQYASIYAEAQLRDLLEKQVKSKKKSKSGAEVGELFLFSREYVPLFTAIAAVSPDNFWRRNVAVILMNNGLYQEAAVTAPQKAEDKRDALFWASVMYDSQNYDAAVAFLEPYGDIGANEKLLDDDLLAIALLSDAMVRSGREQEADDARRQLIEALSAGYEFEKNSPYAPALYVNSAYWAKRQNLPIEQHKILASMLALYPNYVPGLVAYGNYALYSASLKEDDPLLAQLRERGRRTTAMERFDAIPRVSVEDAVKRIDDAYAAEGDGRLPAFKAYLLNKLGADSGDSQVQLLGRVWDLLEKSAIGTNLYPSDVAHYAVGTLVHSGEEAEARKLFSEYLQAKYGSGGKAFVPHKKIASLDLWECEYAAYFACLDADADAARQLYEFLLTSGKAASQDMANFAMVCSSTGDSKRALELYANASGGAADDAIKAELLYRMACLYEGSNRTGDAVYAIEYALQLQPSHIKARLLQKNLQKAR